MSLLSRFDWIEVVLVALLAVAAALLLGLVAWGVDYALGRTEQRQVEVQRTVRHAAYTSFMMSGKVMVPVYHPESYGVVALDLKTRKVNEYGASRSWYDTARKGDVARVDVRIGGISGLEYR